MLPPRIGWKESHYNMSMKDNIELIESVVAVFVVLVVSSIGINLLFKWWIWCLSLAGVM